VQRIFFLLFLCLAIGWSQTNCQAAGLKITKIPGNCGYVETATVSYYQGKMYVGGWLKPHYWGSVIHFQVDVKDAAGSIIASKKGYSNVTGRPQTIVQFGVSYVESFDSAQVAKAAAVDVRYIN
jgi:hypothetical protein